MHQDCHNDEKRINESGIRARFGRRLGRGSVLRLEGVAQIVRGITHRLVLATQFPEVELVGSNGAESLFIASESLLEHPHIFLAYDSVGRPVLVPRHDLSIAMFGAPGSGKSTEMGIIASQPAMLGDATLIISMKTDDPTLIAPAKHGADALTKVDAQGRLVSSPFYYISFQPGQPTMAHNFVAALRQSNRQLWMNIEEGMLASGVDEQRMTGAEMYFAASFRKQLRELGDLGGSPRELTDRLAERVKNDRNADYATAGWRYKWEMLREIEQLNLPAGHPANLNNEEIHRQGGVIFFAACYPEAVGAASLGAALLVKDFCDAKRRADPERKKHAWIFIDEIQYFSQAYLNFLLTQVRGEKIHLVVAQQNLEQSGDYVETVLQPSVKMIFSAQPGERTDKFLQAHGTKREFFFSFNRGTNSGTSKSFGESVSALGTTLSSTDGQTRGNQAGYGLSEHETLDWGPNDTLELNSDPNALVVIATPNAGCFQYGPKPLRCRRQGMLFPSFAEVDRIYREVISDTTNKILPGKKPPKSLSAPKLSPELQAKRSAWLTAFEKTAARIREAIG
jgi:hypothetical protein